MDKSENKPEVKKRSRRRKGHFESLTSKIPLRLLATIPYTWTAWIACHIYSSGWFQKRYCEKRRNKFENFSILAGIKIDMKSSLLISCLTKHMKHLNMAHVAYARQDILTTLFSVSGFEQVQKLYRQGQKLIFLNSHFGGARILPLWLARNGVSLASIERGHLISAIRIHQPKNLTIISLDNFPARTVFAAAKALKDGQMLHVLGDGFHGAQNQRVPFFGPGRSFPSGFADLAVSSGALVIPVFIPIGPSGRPYLEFLDPLDSGDSSETSESRVLNLVRQYADLLESRWREHPGCVNTVHMKKVLEVFTMVKSKHHQAVSKASS